MVIDFNKGWLFYREQNGVGVSVELPHDAMIDGKRSPMSLGGAACAYFEGGIYRYAKEFTVPSEWQNKSVYFKFGGVYRKTKIYINSVLAFEWAYGYTSFDFCADKFLKYGDNNVIEVIADNSEQPNSRWYTGGGIYRPVELVVKNKTAHFELNGVRVQTVSINPPTIKVTAKRTSGELRFDVLDNSQIIASLNDEGEIVVPDAKLWSAETPYLYTLKATLTKGDEVVDEEEVQFGIRSLAWSTKGFFVNGQETLLRGGCVHHDNGILGARAYTEAEERKARIIKAAGFNAVRFSHNPCSQAFAAACDKIGLYLIDEYSDMWYMRKKKYDYALDFDQWHEKDIKSIVDKDFNHPSVIMYSIGNEVSEPSQQKGIDTAKKLVDMFHSLDGSRAVTAGINLFIIQGAKSGNGQYCEANVEADAMPKDTPQEPMSSEAFNQMAMYAGVAMNNMSVDDETDATTSPVISLLDIAGYNYASGRYALEGTKHPDRIIFGSETFPQDIYKNWQAVKQYPYLLGDFMWTAIDYLGEVGIGGWHYDVQYGMGFEKPYPWIIADTGAIDIVGNVGAEAKYAAIVWGLDDKPYICVSPLNKDNAKLVKSVWRGTNAISSWSWQGCEGTEAEIEVYSSAEYIELYLNGHKMGTEKVNECKALFKTAYESGKLTAVAIDKDMNEVSRSTLSSAGDLKVNLSSENKSVKADEVVFVEVCIADNNGVVESNFDQRLTATVSGGKLLAFGSAEQKTEEPYSSNNTQTNYGRALLVVKADGTQPLKVTVDSETLQSANLTFEIK